MPVYAFDGVSPRVSADAWIHPDAVLTGHVTVGAQSTGKRTGSTMRWASAPD